MLMVPSHFTKPKSSFCSAKPYILTSIKLD